MRAALELVAAVRDLGGEAALELAARAGIATGETAVTIGAVGQGMVAGDIVNTAARIQGAARPGTVFIDEATRRASEAAIASDAMGAFELKGKAEAMRLWAASRVVANRGGEGRAAGLDPPFTGRDDDLRLCKQLFHTTAEHGRSHLLTVTGPAGIGKSRLAWEFETYVDGLAADVLWHRGRCLSYGDGVAFWALAEMVRMRARITEDDAPHEASARLDAMLAEHVPDAEDRGLDHARAPPAARAWRRPPTATARGCSPPGGCCSSGWRRRRRPCWCSRTCSGPTRRCSTSSST